MLQRTHDDDSPNADFPKLSSQMRERFNFFPLTQLGSSLFGSQRSGMVLSSELLRGRGKAWSPALLR